MTQNLNSPNDRRKARRSLNEHLQDKRTLQTYDTCSIGKNGCNQGPIEAHCISRTALSLIADNGKLIGCDPSLLKTGYDLYSKPFFSEIGIKLFNRGKWACEKHDRIFAPIDSRSINVLDDRVLFLQIYRATVYATHALHRASEAVDLEPGMHRLVNSLNKFPANASQDFAVKREWTAGRYGHLKAQMDELLLNENFGALEYRVAQWKCEPTMAAIAMWCNPTMWTVLLPQEHGQTLITASTKWGSSAEQRVHKDMPQEGKRAVIYRHNTWTRRASLRMLEYASVLAFRPSMWNGLTEPERRRIENYMRERSVRDIRRENLPNLLKI